MTPKEAVVLATFRITGWFNKTPKQQVERSFAQVAKAVKKAGNTMTTADLESAISGLGEQGFLEIHHNEKKCTLTKKGYTHINHVV